MVTSLVLVAHRIRQAIVNSLSLVKQPFQFWVLQIIFYLMFQPLLDDGGAMNLALPERLAPPFSRVCIHVGKHFVDVLLVVTKRGERGPESVVYAFDYLPEVLGYLLEESQDVRITVLLDGLVERQGESECLLYGDRAPYRIGQYGISGPSHKHQGGYLPPCRPNHLRRHVHIMSYARFSGALLLRQNEGPPGERIARPREPFYDQLRLWGYGTHEVIACAKVDGD